MKSDNPPKLHSTGKLAMVAMLVGTLAGAPGFWDLFKSEPAGVTKEEFKALDAKVDSLGSKLGQVSESVAELRGIMRGRARNERTEQK